MESGANERYQADLILYNGKIFTADPSKPYAEAIAIRGEHILAVGTDTQINALTSSNTQRIDLQGHVAIPGFNDAHYHFASQVGYTLSFESMEPTWQETQDTLAEAIKQVPEGNWISGTVGTVVVGDPGVNRFALDRIAPDHPVVLMQYAGAGFVINTTAMRAFKITEEEPDPLGGRYERAPGSKQVNGKIFGYAQYAFLRHLVDCLPDQDIVRGMRAMANEAVQYGVTSIQDMPFVAPDHYVKLLQEAGIPIRLRLIRFPLTCGDRRNITEGRNLPLHPAGQPLLTAHGTKWILDGTPFEWGSALRGAYLDRSDRSGALNFTESEINSMVQEMLQRGDQLLVHCAGDRPVEVLFDAMDQVPGVDWAEKRVRIEHGDGVVGDLMPRACSLGAIVVQNPTHFSLKDLVAQRYGPETPFYPQRSLLKAGVPLAIGSDGPMNPCLNIMFAVLHPVHPEEAITREQAVEAYTKGSAFAEFKEQEKGTLTAGKLADIAVLSQDIFTIPVEALPGTESILTLVGGKIVYNAGRLN